MNAKLSEYNIIGPAVLVSEVISEFMLGRPSEVWPTKDPAIRDVNVLVPAEKEDDFTDWCEEHKIFYKCI